MALTLLAISPGRWQRRGIEAAGIAVRSAADRTRPDWPPAPYYAYNRLTTTGRAAHHAASQTGHANTSPQYLDEEAGREAGEA